MRPTPTQLAKLESLATAVQAAKATGFNDKMTMQVYRRPKPNAVRIRVLPGVMGELVQWGDGTALMPTVAFVKIADMERYIARCREEIAWSDD